MTAAVVMPTPLTSVRTKVHYNTAEKEVTFQVGSTVLRCDEQAVAALGVATNPHMQGLFRRDGVTELLPLGATISRVHGNEPPPAGTVGIKEEEELILRASTVRGG